MATTAQSRVIPLPLTNNGHGGKPFAPPIPWFSFLTSWLGIIAVLFVLSMFVPAAPHHPENAVASALLSGFEEIAIGLPTGSAFVYKRLARPVLVHGMGLPMPPNLRPRESFPPACAPMFFAISVYLGMMLIFYADRNGMRFGITIIALSVGYHYILPYLV